jgi:hypothetical protein
MFLGFPDPDPLVRCMDPDPDLQTKIVRKTLIPTVLLLLLDFLSLKNDANVPSKRTGNKQKNFQSKIFVVGVFKVNDEISRIRIRIRIN